MQTTTQHLDHADDFQEDEVTQKIPIVRTADLGGPALWSGYTKPNRHNLRFDVATTQPLQAVGAHLRSDLVDSIERHLALFAWAALIIVVLAKVLP